VEQVQNLGATGAVEQAIVANPGSAITSLAKDILALDTMMLTHAASILESQPARWYLPFALLSQPRNLTGLASRRSRDVAVPPQLATLFIDASSRHH
ncbi:hypothetical protein, partial [Bradyrhizobium sp.]|uniref:hypothetical protein n=1 Tax=Bradyrhizobium sp. TaxID=376 RepID=UPI003C409E56